MIYIYVNMLLYEDIYISVLYKYDTHIYIIYIYISYLIYLYISNSLISVTPPSACDRTWRGWPFPCPTFIRPWTQWSMQLGCVDDVDWRSIRVVFFNPRICIYIHIYRICIYRIYRELYTLPETNRNPLKRDGWKTKLPTLGLKAYCWVHFIRKEGVLHLYTW